MKFLCLVCDNLTDNLVCEKCMEFSSYREENKNSPNLLERVYEAEKARDEAYSGWIKWAWECPVENDITGWGIELMKTTEEKEVLFNRLIEGYGTE